jgi:hypothetical protein
MPQALTEPNPREDGNLDSHPFRVMYNETCRLESGETQTRNREHVGVCNLADARKTVQLFREYASRGSHYSRQFKGYPVLNSAWVEYTHRRRLEV